MCFKKWFSNPVVPPVPASKRALLFGINAYGGGNNLNGCINDINDVEKKLINEFPDFVITKYKDSQVTCKLFYDTIKEAILSMPKGGVLYIHYSGHGTQIPSAQEANGYHEALYLFDGPFIDDRFQELVALVPSLGKLIAKFDSCFSGDMLRELQMGLVDSIPIKNRFYQMEGVPVMHNVVGSFAKAVTNNCIVVSGCSEEQTSADAYINGRYNGAFTYFDNLSYSAKSTYQQEINAIHVYLPKGQYDQNPTIDGDSTLFNKLVFE
jgi:hypothetical protein